MAAQSPSREETKRISPREALPREGALAAARGRMGVEEAETAMRVSAAAERAAQAARAAAKRDLLGKGKFMGGIVAAGRGGSNWEVGAGGGRGRICPVLK